MTSQGWSQYSEVRRNSGPRPLLRREALSRTKAPNTKKSGASTGTTATPCRHKLWFCLPELKTLLNEQRASPEPV